MTPTELLWYVISGLTIFTVVGIYTAFARSMAKIKPEPVPVPYNGDPAWLEAHLKEYPNCVICKDKGWL